MYECICETLETVMYDCMHVCICEYSDVCMSVCMYVFISTEASEGSERTTHRRVHESTQCIPECAAHGEGDGKDQVFFWQSTTVCGSCTFNSFIWTWWWCWHRPTCCHVQANWPCVDSRHQRIWPIHFLAVLVLCLVFCWTLSVFCVFHYGGSLALL